MVNVRIATAEDAGGILEIYKPYILSTAFTFETEVPSLNDFKARIEKYLQRHPWIICEINETLAGYVYASVHREREAYQWTCESSVYINEVFKGKGIAQELYQALFQILKLQGIVNVYAGITLPNDGSVKLHEKCGFVHFATYDNIGFKFNSWHKVGWWRLPVNEYQLEPQPPLKFIEMQTELYTHYLQTAAENITRNISQ